MQTTIKEFGNYDLLVNLYSDGKSVSELLSSGFEYFEVKTMLINLFKETPIQEGARVEIVKNEIEGINYVGKTGIVIKSLLLDNSNDLEGSLKIDLLYLIKLDGNNKTVWCNYQRIKLYTNNVI